MSDSQTPTPPTRFSFGRVLSAVAYVGLAAAVFAAIWLIPWPKSSPRTPTTSVLTYERFKDLKRKVGKAADELERADDGGEKK